MATGPTKRIEDLSDEEWIKAHLQEAAGGYPSGLNRTEAGCRMLAAEADRRTCLVVKGIELWIESTLHDAGKVASELLRSNVKEWTGQRLVKVIEAASALDRTHKKFTHFSYFPHKPLITVAEKVVEREGLSSELRLALERWKTALMPRALTASEERELGEAERITADNNDQLPWFKVSDASTMDRLQRIRTPLTEERKLIERLARLLSSSKNTSAGSNDEITLRIDTTDAVGILVAADTAKGRRAAGQDWAALLQHARELATTTPSRKWSSDAARLVSTISSEKFGACVSDWLNEAGKPAPQRLVSYREVSDATLLNDCSVELLKGLAWSVVAAGRADLAPALGNLAEACFKKVPNIGPRNVKVGNAAVAALAALSDPTAAAQLSRLRLSVKHPSSRATIDKAFAAISRNTWLSPDDLAEMSVPTFGLDARGKRRVEVGDCVCEMRIVSSQKVELSWFDNSGKGCASLPSTVRKGHAADLKRLQREAKDASRMLAAQALRLERSFLTERNWPLEVWRNRFLAHPLTGDLARRLIWQFDDTPAIPHKGGFVNASDRPLTPKKTVVVSLWHPIRSTPTQVLAWRNWLDRHEVTQPFKQAHREIYLLTDAERRTRSYSNRFAGHILRQHQFAALCQQRGWDYRLQGEFDSHNTPTLHLPALGLAPEFWAEAVAGETSPQGIYLYVTTDQVRFGSPLQEVSPAVFSEVMRDVDLFVSVASVANDPTWRDGGPGGRYRAYWEHWSFGDLSATAQTRKEVLQRLVPRLNIAGQCSFADKFLVVKGSLRTYKIHLGSGNILMEPNDQYLCIVPDRGSAAAKAGENVFLPFEGDSTLSVILSKAFLLAEDHRIKDPTILRQVQAD